MKAKNYTHWVCITLDSEDGERTLKQHVFKPKLSRGGNERNISLCGKIRVAEDSGKSAMFDTLIHRAELIDGNNICKTCFKIYLKAINQ